MATNVFVRTIGFDTPATTGILEIEAVLGDKIPKAAMFFMQGQTLDDTGAFHAKMMVGMTDGTRHRVAGGNSQDGLSAVNTDSFSFNDILIYDVKLEGPTASFSSFAANAINVNFTDVIGAAETRPGICTLFAGDDLSAFVGTTPSLGTGAGTVAVTGVGFAPDLVIIVATNDVTSATTTAISDLVLSFGAASRTAATQHSLSWVEDDGSADSNVAQYLNDAAAITILNPADGTVAWTGTVSAWGADGFSITTNASASSLTPIFLALKLGDVTSKTYTTTTPIVVGNQAVTGPGVNPQCVILAGSNLSAVNTVSFNSALASSFSLSAFDNAEEENACSARINFTEVGAISDVENDYQSVAYQSGTDTDIDAISASLVSLSETGYTLNFTAVQGTAKKGFGIAIEKGDTIPSQIGFTFAEFSDDSFYDWVIGESVGANFDSYLRTFYQAADDEMFYLQAPYIYVFLDNQTPSTAEDPTLTESLLLRGAWDWHNSADSKRWSRETQVYKYRQNNLVAISRTKIRGRGRVLQLRFDSEEGKDFKLLGWGLPIGKNTDP